MKKTDKQRGLPTTAKTFSNTGGGLTPIEIGEEIRGKFVHMKNVDITDRETRLKKPIRVYVIDTPEGRVSIGSKVLLDQLFDEVALAFGGIEKLTGKELVITRGEDVETAGGQSMGTFEISVL